MTQYIHKYDNSSANAPAASDISLGEICINNSINQFALNGGTDGRLYIKLLNNEIRRFISLGLPGSTDPALRAKYGGTNNDFSNVTSTNDHYGDSLMVFKYGAGSGGDHKLDVLPPNTLTWDDNTNRLNIHRSGEAQATVHIGGDIAIDNIDERAGNNQYDSNFYFMGATNNTPWHSLQKVSLANFFNLFPSGIPSSKLSDPVPINKGGTGSDFNSELTDNNFIYYSLANNKFQVCQNLTWYSDGTYETFVFGGLPSGAGTSLVVDGNGFMSVDTSAKRFKENIQDYNIGLDKILSLNPKTFNLKNDPNKTIRAGLIAEDLKDIGLDIFVMEDNNGQPVSIAYDKLVVLLINSIKELKAQIDQIKG